MPGEFDLIREYFTRPPRRPEVLLGVGDDAALLRIPAGTDLALCVDTLVAGRHFSHKTAPADIGWKALAVNLSDLAAMGAAPAGFTLALTLPEDDAGWLQEFAAGLFALADRYALDLIGGDTTRGPLTVSIQAHGYVPQGQALRRAGAQPGDLVCVTGTLGDAALALALGTRAERFLHSRLNCPEPRIAAGLALRRHAHAAIDLSDGLAGDLAHVLRASGVGAEIRLEALPVSPAFSAAAPAARRLQLLLSGGDDYELCVCLPEDRFEQARSELDCPLTAIGRITAEPALVWRDAGGRALPWAQGGYDHFAEPA